ncbi:uncharacterized protein (TIGR03577 family) [Virgibacillus halotolerans]|uniref:SFCGS family glycine-rich protein n=1 Tax=Virgibacillus halotolerans TaxID=1071053 RepID=UPI001961DDF0|nr:SFCGS family glycine-rich protein [Virgibacillus halotolerans]MBM7599025.1 uncharacterized protein (TIGR03577 family) [Virgibacillus halotolerans]
MITVVIADRLGKGQNVARGAEEAGANVILVPGVGADIKLGDVMKEHDAAFGISFCGSGGAGAIAAQTKHQYPAKYGMRSIQEGITAIENGKKALGFGFMDSAELGKALVEAYNKEAKKSE